MGYRQSSKLFLKRHYLAILFAIVVGVMSVAPRLLLINSLPSILFNIPLVDILVFNKFLFPFALFLLSCALVYLLTGKPDYLSGKFNAIAGGLLVTLGYNFVDYKNT